MTKDNYVGQNARSATFERNEPHKVSAPENSFDYYRRLQMAEGQLFIATELLKDVANSGIEDALNTKYMVIQIDRETWDAVQKYKVEGERCAQTPDEPVFKEWEVVTGDINCRSDPGSRMRLNTSMSWIVGPAHRSTMKAREELEMILEMLDERKV